MTTTTLDPAHARYIPDKTDIITDTRISRGNVLETLEDAIEYNALHLGTSITLDAYEDMRFIEACAKALDGLDKTDSVRAQRLLTGLKLMLDPLGINLLETQCHIAEIF